ncbi:MAG: class I SAM-dependent methyltransferase [Candidatus Saganbacteria bacterium]|nr:class I SAM-dependent methyltransferase [Candidatus Saganbacteria bacterium]
MAVFADLLKRVLPSDKRYWNFYAPVLEVLRSSRRYNTLVSEVNKQLDLKPTDRVLETGTGTGNWAIPSCLLAGQVVGLEFSPAMVERAQRNLAGNNNVELRQWDLEKGLPQDLGVFHKAVSVAVHGYLKNRQQLTTQVAQALAPGGIFAMATPCLGAKFLDVLKAEVRESWQTDTFPRFVLKCFTKLPLGTVAALVFGGIVQLKAKIGAAHFYAKDELEAEFRQAGLSVVYSTITYASQYLLVVGRKN